MGHGMRKHYSRCPGGGTGSYSHVVIGASMPLIDPCMGGHARQPSADIAWGLGATLRDACRTAPACAVGIRVLCLDASPRSPARIQGS